MPVTAFFGTVTRALAGRGAASIPADRLQPGAGRNWPVVASLSGPSTRQAMARHTDARSPVDQGPPVTCVEWPDDERSVASHGRPECMPPLCPRAQPHALDRDEALRGWRLKVPVSWAYLTAIGTGARGLRRGLAVSFGSSSVV